MAIVMLYLVLSRRVRYIRVAGDKLHPIFEEHWLFLVINAVLKLLLQTAFRHYLSILGTLSDCLYVRVLCLAAFIRSAKIMKLWGMLHKYASMAGNTLCCTNWPNLWHTWMHVSGWTLQATVLSDCWFHEVPIEIVLSVWFFVVVMKFECVRPTFGFCITWLYSVKSLKQTVTKETPHHQRDQALCVNPQQPGA